MGLKDKFNIGQNQILSGAKNLQKLWNSISESLTNIEKALNHNTVEIGKALKGMMADIDMIKDKLRIDDDDDDKPEKHQE